MGEHLDLGDVVHGHPKAQEELNTLYDEIERLQRERSYYRAGILREPPSWVPSRVLVIREQFGDPPFRGAGIAPGEHDCRCNKWGAVSVLDRDGKPLGLRLHEFEPVAWRENLPSNAEVTGLRREGER